LDAVTVKLFTREEYLASSAAESTIKPVRVDQVALTPVGVGSAIVATVEVGAGLAAIAVEAVTPATAKPIKTALNLVVRIATPFLNRIIFP
jgi:hypothetical protein